MSAKPVLHHSDCNLSAIRYSKKINGKQAIIASYPTEGRAKGKIFTLLVNDDNSMSLLHSIDVPGSQNSFIYSSLTELEDGSIGIFWEKGARGTEMFYDNFSIGELIPEDAELTLAGAQEETQISAAAAKVKIEKGETYTKAVNLPSDSASAIEKAPNPNIATAEIGSQKSYIVKVPVYNHTQNAGSLDSAFSTLTSQPSMMNLADAEFSFNKTDDGWQIQSNLNQKYLTLASGADYFSGTAGAVAINANTNGTIQIFSGNNYAGFYKTQMNFNRANDTSRTDLIFNLSLWEKIENASEDNSADARMPKYKKLQVSSVDDLNGKNCLIGVEYEGKVLLVYPVGGEHNQTKLVASKSDTVDTSNTLETFAPRYTANALQTTSYVYSTATETPQWTNLSDMEFTFTKSGSGWNIKNNSNGTYIALPAQIPGDSYFNSAAAEITIAAETDGSVTMKSDSFAVFYQPWKRFNRGSSSDSTYRRSFILWEKSSDATVDSEIPGYQKVSVTTDTLDNLTNRSFLISAIYNGIVFLLNPQNGSLEQTRLLMPEVAVPVYSHASENSDLATAFATATADPDLLGLTAAEFKFTKNNDKYHIYNNANGWYLTFADGTNATNYFSDTARDVTVTPQDDGKIRLSCVYTNSSNVTSTGYAGFHKTNNMNWNRVGESGISGGVYDLTLWERDANASADSPIPGYTKVSVPNTGIEENKSYLITAELDDEDGHIVLLHPEQGANHNKTKLIGDITQSIHRSELPEAADIPDPVIIENTGISITGVNEGQTTAIIGNTEFIIQVTDSTEFKPNNAPLDIPYFNTPDLSDVNTDVATAEIITDDAIVLHDRSSRIVSGSASSFEYTPQKDLSITDAEFTFTEAEGEENAGKWIVKSGGKYLVHNERGDKKNIFGTEATPLSVTKTDNAGTFRILNPTGSKTNGERYLMFVNSKMQFDAMGAHSPSNDFLYEFTLWKKDASVTTGPLPGYQRLTANDSIENNGVYLITMIIEENNQEHVILLWPNGSDDLTKSDTATKLARLDSILRVTPKEAGSGTFTLTIDGTKHIYQFANPDCTHNGDTYIKGSIDKSCEYEGYSGDTVCSLCGTVTQKGTSIAGEHAWEEAVTLQALSNTENGIYLSSCTNDKRHQKKTIVYASAYKHLQEVFQTTPEELSDANKPLYAADDVSALTAAYTKGNTVSQKNAAEQTNKEMYSCLNDFEKARKTLLLRRERIGARLTWGIAAAEPIHSAGKQPSNSQSVWDAFETAYTAATAAGTDGKTYAELTEIITNLQESRLALTLENAKAALQTLYDAHKDKEKGDYSDSSWTVFTTALKAAEDVLAKPSPTTAELNDAAQALTAAVSGLRTNADETIEVPGSISYTAPKAGKYPKAANVTVNEDDSKHAKAISDWTKENPALTRNDASSAPEILNKKGIWAFNDMLSSTDAKFNVHGDNQAMAITYKLWLNKIPDAQTEIIGKGHQYDFQFSEGNLTMWMESNHYPTEHYAINAAEHTGKWLDIVIFIKGSSTDGTQRFYVNGKASAPRSDLKPVLDSSPDPFTICYNPLQGGADNKLAADTGYLADIRFYNLGSNDISNGLSNSYEQIVSQLDAMDADAVISANPFDTKTVWSSVNGDTETAMNGTEAFAADTIYKATTTFQANDYFRFPNSDAFKKEVAAKVTAGVEGIEPAVVVSADQKTMTVTVTYPAGKEEVPDACNCSISEVTITSPNTLFIPSNKDSETLKLTAKATTNNLCPVENHPQINQITYSYAIKDESNTAGATIDNDVLTATQTGKVTVTATATLASGTETGISKTAETEIQVTKAEEGTFIISFDANAEGDEENVTGMPENTTIAGGEKLAKPEKTPQREGYSFKGWSISKDGEVIADSDWPLEITEDTTLHAIWEKDGEETPVTKEEAEAAADNAIAKADSLYTAGQGNYTQDSWNAFETAYKNLTDARNNPDITPEELKNLAEALDKARTELTLDEQKIQETVNSILTSEAGTINAGNTEYTAESWNTYAEAYNALQTEAAKGEKADPAKLDSLQKALEAAKKALTADTVWKDAKTALNRALTDAQTIYAGGNGNSGKKYTDASWQAFVSAYTNAYAQQNAIAGNSTADSLNALAAALNDARTKLALTTPAPTPTAPKLKKGDSVTLGGVKYVVTNAAKKTVSAQGDKSKKNKKFKAVIKDTVAVKNVKCKVTEIKAKGFSKFTKLSQVTIGKNVTKIGKQAFKDCKSITKLTVNGNVKTFDSQCFNNCKKLKSITFKGKKVPTFKSKSFKGTASKITVKLAKGMTKKNKNTMKSRLKKAGISKKASIR